MIDSVLSQSYADWELLLLDDGSTDSTLSVLRRYECADPRIRVFAQSNAGVSAARNRLLREARGTYLAFADSDDLMPPNALKWMMGAMRRHDADIVEGRMVEFHCEDEVTRYMAAVNDSGTVRCMSAHRAVELSLYQNGVTSSMSAKVFRRGLFDSLEFPEGELYEDLSLFNQVALRAGRYVTMPDITYLYRQREGSLIHSFNSRRLVVLDATERIVRRMESLGDRRLLCAARDRRLSAAFNMLGLLLNAADASAADASADVSSGNDGALAAEEIKRYADVCRHIIKSSRLNTLLSAHARTKNRIGALLAMLLPSPLLDGLLKRTYRRDF